MPQLPQPLSTKGKLHLEISLSPFFKVAECISCSVFSLELANSAVNESPCFWECFAPRVQGWGWVQQDDKQPLEGSLHPPLWGQWPVACEFIERDHC